MSYGRCLESGSPAGEIKGAGIVRRLNLLVNYPDAGAGLCVELSRADLMAVDYIEAVGKRTCRRKEECRSQRDIFEMRKLECCQDNQINKKDNSRCSNTSSSSSHYFASVNT